MKNIFRFVFFLFFASINGQNAQSLEFVEDYTFKANSVFGIDTFGTKYYSDKNESFYKKNADTTISYANFQLGKISSANAFNPFKINLFYKDFNTSEIA